MAALGGWLNGDDTAVWQALAERAEAVRDEHEAAQPDASSRPYGWAEACDALRFYTRLLEDA